jgi:hypothetical protein
MTESELSEIIKNADVFVERSNKMMNEIEKTIKSFVTPLGLNINGLSSSSSSSSSSSPLQNSEIYKKAKIRLVQLEKLIFPNGLFAGSFEKTAKRVGQIYYNQSNPYMKFHLWELNFSEICEGPIAGLRLDYEIWKYQMTQLEYEDITKNMQSLGQKIKDAVEQNVEQIDGTVASVLEYCQLN